MHIASLELHKLHQLIHLLDNHDHQGLNIDLFHIEQEPTHTLGIGPHFQFRHNLRDTISAPVHEAI